MLHARNSYISTLLSVHNALMQQDELKHLERRIYTTAEITELLYLAQKQGHPLDKDSYLRAMSLQQLDNLVHGRYDT